ncbi:MAG: hypothetical protein ACRDD1_09365, partial [Planctomycetia bacterium]
MKRPLISTAERTAGRPSTTSGRMNRWGLTAALVGLTLAAAPAHAASARSENFIVTAQRLEVAQQVCQYAEKFRKQKAMEWLGTELPRWPEPCPVQVKITFGGAGGATAFDFETQSRQVRSQQMTVEGPLERILHSVLPHEITHTIFAAKFGRPLPRWADEGGSVLSEDSQEVSRHDYLVREIINSGRMIPLRRLFVLTEYPKDVMALYAQGFSVANYLVAQRGRAAFLDFVWDGDTLGWDVALQRHYAVPSVEHLESRWIEWLTSGRFTGADGLAPLASSESTYPHGKPADRAAPTVLATAPTKGPANGPASAKPAAVIAATTPRAA